MAGSAQLVLDNLGLARSAARRLPYQPDPVWSMEDLEQEAVVGLLQAATTYNGRSAWSTWGFRHASWHLRDRLRSAGRRIRSPGEGAEVQFVSLEEWIGEEEGNRPEHIGVLAESRVENLPDQQLNVSAEHEALWQALGDVDGIDREVLSLRYVEMLDIETSAQRLCLSQGRVSQIHKRAIGKLRTALAE